MPEPGGRPRIWCQGPVSGWRLPMRVISEYSPSSAKSLTGNRENFISGLKRSERDCRRIRAFGCDADPGVIDFGEGGAHVGYRAFDRVVQYDLLFSWCFSRFAHHLTFSLLLERTQARF